MPDTRPAEADLALSERVVAGFTPDGWTGPKRCRSENWSESGDTVRPDPCLARIDQAVSPGAMT